MYTQCELPNSVFKLMYFSDLVEGYVLKALKKTNDPSEIRILQGLDPLTVAQKVQRESILRDGVDKLVREYYQFNKFLKKTIETNKLDQGVWYENRKHIPDYLKKQYPHYIEDSYMNIPHRQGGILHI